MSNLGAVSLSDYAIISYVDAPATVDQGETATINYGAQNLKNTDLNMYGFIINNTTSAQFGNWGPEVVPANTTRACSATTPPINDDFDGTITIGHIDEPQLPGACCIGENCSQFTASACTTAGGTFYGEGVACTTGLCLSPPANGACCYTDGTCAITTQTGCTGIYQGDSTTCTPNPCTQPPPPPPIPWVLVGGVVVGVAVLAIILSRKRR